MAIAVECVVDSHSHVGEGAYWDEAQQCLYWVDIPQGLIYRYAPATGSNDSQKLDEAVGCLAVRERGGLVIATRSGFYFYDPETGRKEAISDPETHLEQNRFNDGTTDPRGRFLAGTMHEDKPQKPLASFYTLHTDLKVTKWLDGIHTTNGLAFSPDGKTLYASDTNMDVQTIWAFDYDLDDGAVSNQRVFFETGAQKGRPDGGTVDTEGCYWSAGVDGWQLMRITPDGRLDMVIDLPIERPSKTMFGGPDLKTLFVTSIGFGLTPGSEEDQPHAGGLFAVTGHGFQGLAQPKFKG